MDPYIMSRYVACRVSEAAADKISFSTSYNLLATGFKCFHSITKEPKLLEISKTCLTSFLFFWEQQTKGRSRRNWAVLRNQTTADHKLLTLTIQILWWVAAPRCLPRQKRKLFLFGPVWDKISWIGDVWVSQGWKDGDPLCVVIINYYTLPFKPCDPIYSWRENSNASNQLWKQ